MAEYQIREIEEKDLENGFLETVNFLREVGNLPIEKAKEILRKIKNNPNYKIFVATNREDKIIGSTTLLIEQKFTHEGGLAGHIEDVVVHGNFQHQGIGTALMNKAIETAKETGCYKIILDCSEKNVPFYEKLGFKKHEVEMRLSLK